MRNGIYVLLLIAPFTACNNNSQTSEPAVTDTVAQKPATDSVAKYIHSFTDTALENKITAALMKLSFVQKSNRYIDSFSNHQHGIAFLLDKADENEPDISVQAGYNGEERFETYYRFFVNPQTLDIKVYDAAEDRKLTLKEFQKTLK